MMMSLSAIINTTNPLNTTHEIAKQIINSNPLLALAIPPKSPQLAPLYQSFSWTMTTTPTPILSPRFEEMAKKEPGARHADDDGY